MQNYNLKANLNKYVITMNIGPICIHLCKRFISYQGISLLYMSYYDLAIPVDFEVMPRPISLYTVLFLLNGRSRYL